MAKVSYSKLGLKINQNVKTFEWNDLKIEVKQYLPISEKFSLISDILMFCQDTDNNNFLSISKMTMYLAIEILIHYTNINITDKMKEDPAKLYDLVASSGLLNRIYANMDNNEYSELVSWCNNTAEHLYQYRNSVYAILDAMTTDYDNLKLDIEDIEKDVENPEVLKFLKETLSKMG